MFSRKAGKPSTGSQRMNGSRWPRKGIKAYPGRGHPDSKTEGQTMGSYIALLRKEKDSDIGVDFPDFPGCITVGNTLE